MSVAQIREHLAEIADTLQRLARQDCAPGSAESIAKMLLSGQDVTIPSAVRSRAITLRGASPAQLLGVFAHARWDELSDEEVAKLVEENIAAAIGNMTNFHNSLLAYRGILHAAAEVP